MTGKPRLFNLRMNRPRCTTRPNLNLDISFDAAYAIRILYLYTNNVIRTAQPTVSKEFMIQPNNK